MAFLAAAAPFLQVAGAVVGVIGALQQGRQQETVHQGQATASEAQATILEQQAQRDVDIAAEEEADLRQRVRRMQATSRARLGGAGVTPSGTPALVAEDLAAEAELQALRIRSGGALTAHRTRQEAGLERFSAAQSRSAGKRARSAGFFRAIGQAAQGLSAVSWG